MSDSPITWRDVARWGGIITTVVACTLWLSRIDAAVVHIKSDVAEIKASVKAHTALPAHPVAEYRLKKLEEAHAPRR